MPLAGFTIAQGKMDFLPAIAAGVIGTVVGALPWYYIGFWVGEGNIRRLADRYGRWITVSGKDIDQANAWFTRHGITAVLFCRLVPGIRTLISLPAGLNRMPLLPFLVYTTIGTTLWVGFLTGAGYGLGNNYKQIELYLEPLSKVSLGILGLIFILWIIWHYYQQKKST
jgi:membrane protein DedA with SNARE-associated domain